MTRTVVEILKEAKGLIDTPEKWTKGAYARDALGIPKDEYSSDAVCFCSLGALYRSRSTATLVSVPSYELAWDTLFVAMRQINPDMSSVARFNDLHNHAEVMEMWDKAIEMAEESNNG